jgi:Tfp pilus assembly protein PilE
LASIALPKYLQVAEKGRITEAKSVLSSLRSAQLRYAAQYGTFAASFANLDYVSTTMKYFNPPSIPAGSIGSAPATADGTVVAIVQRNGVDVIAGPMPGYSITITQGGTLAPLAADPIVQKLL